MTTDASHVELGATHALWRLAHPDAVLEGGSICAACGGPAGTHYSSAEVMAAGVPHDEQRIGPTGDYRAIGYGSFAWLRMTWPDEFLRIAQRHPWVRQCA